MKKYVTILLVCCLLMNMLFPKKVIACCSPPCAPHPCKICTGEVCVNDNDGWDCGIADCKKCSSGDCVYKSGNDCEQDSDCDGCDKCVDCFCTDSCDPDSCQSCIDDSCAVCGGDTSKCCDNGTCVDKCDPSGGSMCTWTDPPVVDPICDFVSPEMPICKNPDALCKWETTSGPGLNATCADCAPGCTITTYCVVLKPVLCYEGLWPFPPFYMCNCTKVPGLYDPEVAGTRYICPP